MRETDIVSQTDPLQLTVSIPAFNEEESLAQVVHEVINVLGGMDALEFEILIVNDGSTDRTGSIADELARSYDSVRVHHHRKNKGFAEAQQSCFREAQLEWVFLLPADNQIRIPAILDFLLKVKEADLVLGIRKIRIDALFSDMFSQLYYTIIGWLFGLKIRDFGPCLLVRRSLTREVGLLSRSPVAITELVVKTIFGGGSVGSTEVFIFPRQTGAPKSRPTAKGVFQIIRDLRTLYHDVTDQAHPFYRDPEGYQKAFLDRIRGK